MRKRKLKPEDPEFMARILEGIRNMTDEELIARMNWRPEGVEETDRNAWLAEYDRKRREEQRKEQEEAKKQNEAA